MNVAHGIAQALATCYVCTADATRPGTPEATTMLRAYRDRDALPKCSSWAVSSCFILLARTAARMIKGRLEVLCCQCFAIDGRP